MHFLMKCALFHNNKKCKESMDLKKTQSEAEIDMTKM